MKTGIRIELIFLRMSGRLEALVPFSSPQMCPLPAGISPLFPLKPKFSSVCCLPFPSAAVCLGHCQRPVASTSTVGCIWHASDAIFYHCGQQDLPIVPGSDTLTQELLSCDPYTAPKWHTTGSQYFTESFRLEGTSSDHLVQPQAFAGALDVISFLPYEEYNGLSFFVMVGSSHPLHLSFWGIIVFTLT